MAIKITASSIGVKRTSGGFLNPAGNFSFCFWFQFTGLEVPTTAIKYRTLSILGDDTFAAAYLWTGSAPVLPTDFQLDSVNAAAAEQTTSVRGWVIPTIWYHCAVTYDGATHVLNLYLNGSLF